MCPSLSTFVKGVSHGLFARQNKDHAECQQASTLREFMLCCNLYVPRCHKRYVPLMSIFFSQSPILNSESYSQSNCGVLAAANVFIAAMVSVSTRIYKSGEGRGGK